VLKNIDGSRRDMDGAMTAFALKKCSISWIAPKRMYERRDERYSLRYDMMEKMPGD